MRCTFNDADLSEALEALRAVTIRTLATRDLEIDFETLTGVWVTPGIHRVPNVQRKRCTGFRKERTALALCAVQSGQKATQRDRLSGRSSESID